jgi:hypothetical protein
MFDRHLFIAMFRRMFRRRRKSKRKRRQHNRDPQPVPPDSLDKDHQASLARLDRIKDLLQPEDLDPVLPRSRVLKE